MAAKEMFDYFTGTLAPDYNFTFPVVFHGDLAEHGFKTQEIHHGDDVSEERISYDDQSIFALSLQWETLTESEAGDVIDWYYDAAKGNGIVRSFKIVHADGHTYTARYDCEMERVRKNVAIFKTARIDFAILGVAPP